MITLIKLQALFGDLAPRGMSQVFGDWEMLVGMEAVATVAPIKIGSGAKEIACHVDPKHVVVETQVQKGTESLGTIFFAFPNSLVIEIIAEVLMIPESAKEEKSRSGLSDNDIETFQEMANLLCGSWNRVFQEQERDLRISQSVDDLKVSATVGDPSALETCVPPGRVAWIDCQVQAADSSFPSMIMLPFEVAIAIAEEFYGIMDPRSSREVHRATA